MSGCGNVSGLGLAGPMDGQRCRELETGPAVASLEHGLMALGTKIVS